MPIIAVQALDMQTDMSLSRLQRESMPLVQALLVVCTLVADELLPVTLNCSLSLSSTRLVLAEPGLVALRYI